MAYVKKLDIFDLARRAIEEEGMWGESEQVQDRARQSKRVGVVAPAVARATMPSAAIAASSPVEKSEKAALLEAFRAEICQCQKCPLAASRIKFVFGVGSPDARLMFIGEGPGYDEDRQGEPFVGRAGQLLNKIIGAMGLTRPAVYIANVVKCHPVADPTDVEQRGNDRPPSPEEVGACLPYLQRQIDIIKPAVICALGNSAVHHLLDRADGITKLRGRFFEYRGIPLMPTYHPAALLRNPVLKKDTWDDMKQIMARLAHSQ